MILQRFSDLNNSVLISNLFDVSIGFVLESCRSLDCANQQNTSQHSRAQGTALVSLGNWKRKEDPEQQSKPAVLVQIKAVNSCRATLKGSRA